MDPLLVTGGCGFIGSNFIRLWRELHPEAGIINLDLLTYAGNKANLSDLEGDPNYAFVHGGIADPELIGNALEEHRPEAIINFAAESHNSRAVIDPLSFTRTNVLGTHVLIEAARKAGIARFHHVSTCEVFGDLALDDERSFTEESPYRPRTPYNASKAGGDHIVRAYRETYGMAASISYCANNYGPRQHPEKLIPHFITSLLQGRKLTLYESSANKREWIHVRDHCRALALILERGQPGCVHNVGTGLEMDIEEVADRLLAAFGLDGSRKTYVPDRPGHDRRYLLDSSRLMGELGWEAAIPIDEGLAGTIEWYRSNEGWWRPLLDADAIDEAAWR